ncbi:hypothetical protein YC2023_011396 [Brassica napus]
MSLLHQSLSLAASLSPPDSPPGNSIVVMNNSVSGFAVDGILVTEPDLFPSSQMCL